MKIGFVKDAFGGMPHVMATEQNGNIQVKSITEFGKSIINDFDFDSNNISTTIPDGFMFTGFFDKTGKEETLSSEKKLRQKSFVYAGFFHEKSLSNQKNVSSILINKFSNSVDKINAIAFKAAAFKTSSRRSEFLNRVNTGKVLFDQPLGRIVQNPKFSFSHVEEEILRDSFGDGFIRKTAKKTKAKRRLSRRARLLSNLNNEDSYGSGKTTLSRIDKARKDVKNGR
jgi:hypothetical protein